MKPGLKKYGSMDPSRSQTKKSSQKLTASEKDQIVKEYAKLIRIIALRISQRLPPNIEVDDLISAGVIGLMDAIDKWDPSYDCKFKSYAEFRIRGAILDELRSQDWVPRSVRDKAKKIGKVSSLLERQLGRTPTDEEMASNMSLTLEEYQKIAKYTSPSQMVSIDEENFTNGDKRSLLEILENVKLVHPIHVIHTQGIKNIIAESIELLPDRQKIVLSLYYYEELNLKDIAKVLRISESRASQLHSQGVNKLRIHLEEAVLAGKLEVAA